MEKQNTEQKTLTFVFFPVGRDVDGNGGPEANTPGRIEVTVRDIDDPYKETYQAFLKLPVHAQELIKKTLKRKSPKRLRAHIEEGCGWGDPFFFGCKEWDELNDID